MQCLEVFCKSFFHVAKRFLNLAEKNGISCSGKAIFTEFFGLLGVFELFTLRVLSGVVGLMAELVAGRLELVLVMAGVLSVVVGLTAELVDSRLLELVLALGAILLPWILPLAPPSATASR